MKKKLLSFILAICLIVPCALFLSACGGNNDNSNNGDNQANSGNGNSWIQYYDYKLEYFVDGELYHTVNKIPSNTNLELPAPPTKEGYIFAGWDVIDEWGSTMALSKYVNEASSDFYTFYYGPWDPLTSNQKAYAKWVVDDGMYFTEVNSASYAGKDFKLCYEIYQEDKSSNNIAGKLYNQNSPLKRSVDTIDLSYILETNKNTTMQVYYMGDFYNDGNYQEGQLCYDIANLPIDPTLDCSCFYIVINNQNQETKIFELVIQRNGIVDCKFYNVDELVYNYECETDEKIIAPTETNYSNGLDGYTFLGWTDIPGSDNLIDFKNNYSFINDTFYAVYTNGTEQEDLFEVSYFDDSKDICLSCGYTQLVPENITIPTFLYTHPVNAFAPSSHAGLINITLPSNIRLYENMFEGCSNLKSVTFEGDFSELPKYIFSECPNLEVVTLASSLTKIDEYAFNNCSSLHTIDFGHTLQTIGNYAFYGCSSLNNIIFSNTLSTIGNYAFAECTSMTSAILPRELDSLGEYVFKNCSGLINVELPDNCPLIAFILYGANNVQSLRANFDKVTPHSLFVRDGAEGGIPISLTKIVVTGNKILNLTTNNVISNKNANVKEIVFESMVKEIHEDFKHWPTVQTITFKDGIELDYLGSFNTNLTPLDNIPEVIKELGSLILTDDITEIPFDKLTHLTKLEEIQSNAITEVIFPEDSKVIELRSLQDVVNLKKIVLPKKLTCISLYCFKDLRDLEEITIPASVTSIEQGAFINCRSIKKFNLDEDNITYIGKNAFENAELPINSFFKKIVSIDEYAFLECSIKLSEGNEYFVFPSTLKTIGAYAFQEARFSNVKQIEFPATIESIGAYAFNRGSVNENGFTTHSVEYFVFNSFIEDPTDRKNVMHYFTGSCGTIFKNIDSMPDYCFAGLLFRGSLDFSGCTFKSFGNYAFYRASFYVALNINYPDSMTQLGKYAFKDTTILQNEVTKERQTHFVMPQKVTVYDNSFGATDYNNCYGALSGSEFRELTIPYINGNSSIDALFGGLTELSNKEFSLTILGKNKSDFNFSLNNYFYKVDFSAADFDNISKDFFKNCSLLTSVVLPMDFVIPDGFFDYCVNLKYENIKRK